MFHRILHVYDVIDFDPNEYEKIIKNLKYSNFYSGYIEDEKPIKNEAFFDYLDQKSQVYASILQELDPGLEVFSKDSPNKRFEEGEIEHLKEYKNLDDDYIKHPPYTDIKFTSERDTINTVKSAFQPISLQEAIQVNMNLTLKDEELERFNQRYLEKDFIYQKSQRFAMLPPLITIDNEYVETSVSLNVYQDGIATIELMINLPPCNQDPLLSSDPPNSLNLNEVKFYNQKTHYSLKDYWDSYKLNNIHYDKILEYYKKTFVDLTETVINEHSEPTQLFWSFGESNVNLNKKNLNLANPQQKIDKEKKYENFLYQILSNGIETNVKRSTSSKKTNYLKNFKIRDEADLSFWCNKQAGMLFLHSKDIEETIIEGFNEGSNINIEENYHSKEFDFLFQQRFNEYLITTSIQFTKIFELACIQKFNARKILTDIKTKPYSTPKEYEILRSRMNNLTFNYSGELVFNNEGSPKQNYYQIVENLGVNNLYTNAKGFLKDLYEDYKVTLDREFKLNEAYILFVTSALTIILSYSAIKTIYSDLFIQMPILGSIVNDNLLGLTFHTWGAVVYIMISLNIEKFNKTRQ